MSAALPDVVDAWRMVQAGRSFAGTLPLTRMSRLRGSLAGTQGTVAYAIEFGRDALGVAYLGLHLEAGLPLTCQRTLETFVQPVTIDQRLGLIRREDEEAALPEGYEPLLTADGQLNLAEVIEDELILALPVVPLKLGAPSDYETRALVPAAGDAPPNPFAVLSRLKKN